MEDEIAEWTPFAAVEGNQDGSLREEFVAGNCFPKRIAQGKGWKLVADLDDVS